MLIWCNECAHLYYPGITEAVPPCVENKVALQIPQTVENKEGVSLLVSMVAQKDTPALGPNTKPGEPGPYGSRKRHCTFTFSFLFTFINLGTGVTVSMVTRSD